LAHRQTVLRVFGKRHVVRTELGGRVKTEEQLEKAHAKAFRAAIVDAHERHASLLEAEGYPCAEMVRKAGRDMAAGRAWGRAKARYVDCRKGFPTFSYGLERLSEVAARYDGATYEEGSQG
jgi:hypothetical protein